MPCVVVLPQFGIAAGERRNPIEQSLRLIRKGLPPGSAFRAAVVPKMRKDQIVIVTLSGRGDKDVAAIARYEGENLYD